MRDYMISGEGAKIADRRPEIDELIEELFTQRYRQSEARERIARAVQRLGVQEFPKPCLAGSACGEDKKVETVISKLQTIRSLMYGEASELNELADRLETFV